MPPPVAYNGEPCASDLDLKAEAGVKTRPQIVEHDRLGILSVGVFVHLKDDGPLTLPLREDPPEAAVACAACEQNDLIVEVAKVSNSIGGFPLKVSDGVGRPSLDTVLTGVGRDRAWIDPKS